MGALWRVYGCIFGEPGASRLEERFRSVLSSNLRAIQELPSDDEYPKLTRNLFRVNAAGYPEPGFYKTQMIPFAASMKDLGPVWDEWLEKFEGLLEKLCWSSAHLHVMAEGLPREYPQSELDYRWDATSEAFRRALDGPVHGVMEWEFRGGPRHFKAERLADWETFYRDEMRNEPRPELSVGLARALAQQGRRDNALRSLNPENCRWSEAPEIVEARRKILQGRWDP